MIIAYLSSQDCKFFHLSKGNLNKIDRNDLSRKKFFLENRMVILSRELLHITKKIYPSLNKREIIQAINHDLEDLSPYKNFGYYYRITTSSSDSIEVTFWFWEVDSLDKLIKEGFNFNYIIPEDLIFNSKEGTLFINLRDERTYFLFSKENYISSFYSSMPPEDALKIFLKSIKDNIRYVVIYDDNISVESLIRVMIPDAVIEKKKYYEDLPKFLESINVKDFKVKKRDIEEKRLLISLLRLSIYVTIAFSVYFYLSAKNYEKERLFLQSEIRGFPMEQAKGAQQSQIVTETTTLPVKASISLETLRQIEKERPKSILALLDKITSLLPEGSYINSFEIKGNTLTIQINTNASLQILQGLRYLFPSEDIKLLSMVPINQEKNFATLNLVIIFNYEK